MKIGIGAVIGGILALLAIFVLAWILFLGSIFGPGNVSAQWQFAYDNNKALAATAGNVCQARKDEAAAPAVDKSQRTSQRIAYEQNYRRIEADYDAALANAFKAKLVKPSDVPTTAPTLDEELVVINCTP
jgi:uncharacterized iron-regulated membrane protein